MKQIFIYISVLLSVQSYSQYTLDTTNMKAWSSTFMNGNVYGFTSNGHYYNMSFVNHYGVNDSIEIIRSDLTNHTTTSKLIGHRSSSSAFWISSFDSLGQFYTSFNSLGRQIWKFNFKDSIYAENLGNGFLDGQALAYTSSLGNDNNMYFGASSGGTYWCMYNPYTKVLTTYPEIDPQQSYVLTIAGDTDWVYAQVGQYNNSLYAIRKSDGFKKKMFSISAATRFNLKNTTTGKVYVSFYSDTLAGTFRLVNGDTIRVDGNEFNFAMERVYQEVDPTNFNRHPPFIQIAYYDDVLQRFYYNISDTHLDSVNITSDHVSNQVRRIFSFSNDTSHIYYVGDYYGLYYDYNVGTKTSTALGVTGYNLYSTVAVNDSIVYLGNYPSGALFKWNRNKIWTINNGVGGSSNSNPQLVGYFRTQTPAGFHHASCMIQMNDSVLVAAGDVIRVGNTASIASYDMKHNLWAGYDFNKIIGLSASSIVKWRDLVLFSTNGGWGGTPKIYFYNPQSNIMTDSMSFGLYNYGNLYVVGNTLIGVTPGMIYRIDLNKKIVTDSTRYVSANGASIMLSDGRIVVDGNNVLPTWYKFIKLNYGLVYYQSASNLYGIGGYNVMQVKGLTPQTIYPTDTPFQRYLYIKNNNQ